MDTRMVVIVGPTAAGKTECAVSLAHTFDGEIISADSMQVYRYMNIGTAKPTAEERRGIRHHLIDVVDPDEEYNVARFVDEAREHMEQIEERDKNIFVAGGTGLYVRALIGGIFPGPGPDSEYRRALRTDADRFGSHHLFERLREKDPAAARLIHPNDTVRLIRALEVFNDSGESIVDLQRKHGFRDERYKSLVIGIVPDRSELYDRIDRRADTMISRGLVVEVEGLLGRGYHGDLKPMQSMCYRHIVAFIQGVHGLPEAVALMKRDTRHYAKRQMTWFRQERDIQWVGSENRERVERIVGEFLDRHGPEE
ncbi:MAG: tRNA (adenosine(37)-N6)-dimethylallyltransferase MiaA [Deltaproteobacteria bacterium]|nr:tRNA (adenosine(37)-N6)-dimethylallyltransferase MiaA [Deltaproteobacteria bacterium]